MKQNKHIWVLFAHQYDCVWSIHQTKKQAVKAKRIYDEATARQYGCSTSAYIKYNGSMSDVQKWIWNEKTEEYYGA